MPHTGKQLIATGRYYGGLWFIQTGAIMNSKDWYEGNTAFWAAQPFDEKQSFDWQQGWKAGRRQSREEDEMDWRGSSEGRATMEVEQNRVLP